MRKNRQTETLINAIGVGNYKLQLNYIKLQFAGKVPQHYCTAAEKWLFSEYCIIYVDVCN